MKNLLHLLLILVTASCITDSREPFGGVEFDGTGYRPVYMTLEDLEKIEIQAPRQLSKPGKIYTLDPYLFINESGKGIHIIDNSNPTAPKSLSFVSIPANYDMAVKGKWLYADNLSNLLVFDLADPAAPKLSKKLAHAISVSDYPPFSSVYFECVEKSKGLVAGWEKVPMDVKPRCYR